MKLFIPREEVTQAKLLPVMELFGPVIQGEGTLAGSQTFFVRLGGCDYRCSWCDSLHAVIPEQVKAGKTMMSVHDIISALENLVPDGLHDYWLTLSGGNPSMHDCSLLITTVQTRGMKVAIETQGTVFPTWINLCDQITLSPKPPSSGNLTFIDREWGDKWLKCGKWGSKTCIKIVVFDRRDFEYAKEAINYLEATFETDEIDFYFQPGTIQERDFQIEVIEDILNCTRKIIDWVTNEPQLRRVKVLPQVHALLYGYEKGK